MVDVNENLTRQVANLARLELTDQEVRTFTSQLQEILKYVDQLQKIDVSGVEPLNQSVEIEPTLRDDIVIDFEKDEQGDPKVLSSAPDVMDHGFKVPQIVG